MTPGPTTYDAAVRAWAGHLRAGGTLAWEDFLATGQPEPAGAWAGPRPAGPQLEVVHRLSLAAGPCFPDFAGLADVVLGSAAIGRGPVDVPLPWPDLPPYGAPAVAPQALDPRELLRVATGALAAVVARVRVEPAGRLRGRRVPWRGRFAVHGAPRSAAVVRRALLERGLGEGGLRARHVVLAGPLDAMMAEHWAELVRSGGITNWERVWRHAAANDRLPAELEVGAIASRLAERHGPGRVLVVVAPDAARAVSAAGTALGVSGTSAGPADDATSIDLWRRLNRVLDQSVGPDRRRGLATGVLPGLLAPEATPDPRLAPPSAQASWARGVGARLAEQLKHGGYAVHGEPALVVPDVAPSARQHVDAHDTLDLALVALSRAWRLVAGQAEHTGGQG